MTLIEKAKQIAFESNKVPKCYFIGYSEGTYKSSI